MSLSSLMTAALATLQSPYQIYKNARSQQRSIYWLITLWQKFEMIEIFNPPLTKFMEYSQHIINILILSCDWFDWRLKWFHRLVKTWAGGAGCHSKVAHVFKRGFFVDFLCDFLSSNGFTGVREEKFAARVVHSGEDTCWSESKVPAWKC